MAELAITGVTLPDHAAGPSARDQMLRDITAAWLDRQASPHTRRAYQGDLTYWLRWCQDHGLHPLTVRVKDVDNWLAAQREISVRPGTVTPAKVVTDRAALKAIREAQELTQAGLACKAGMAAHSIWKIENGRGGGKDTRQRLAGALGVDAAAIETTIPEAPVADTPSSRRSIARRLSTVSSWYAYLILNTADDDEPLIKHNPAAAATRPDVDRDHSPTTGLTSEEASRLIAAADADGLRSAAIARLMLTNAYRRASIHNARISDLGWDRGHRILTTTIKGGHPVKDPLPPATVAAVDAYLASRDNPEDGPLIATRTGKAVTGDWLYRLIKRLSKEAGVPVVTPHGLRHTAITEYIVRSNGNLAGAQALAHHADARTTQLYNLRLGELDGHAAYILGASYGERSA